MKISPLFWNWRRVLPCFMKRLGRISGYNYNHIWKKEPFQNLVLNQVRRTKKKVIAWDLFSSDQIFNEKNCIVTDFQFGITQFMLNTVSAAKVFQEECLHVMSAHASDLYSISIARPIIIWVQMIVVVILIVIVIIIVRVWWLY